MGVVYNTIVYKVDKSQVDGATVSAEKAKEATDKLNVSVDKLGKQGSKSTIQFGNTIEGVRLHMQRLKAQIDLANQSDTKRLNSLISQYKAAQTQLDKYTSSLKSNNNANSSSVSGVNSLANGFGNLYSAIKLVIGAAIVKQFVNLTLEASELSGKVEGVERAFKRAFPNSALILDQLRKSTHNTITDFELMQRTLQATNLGVSVDKLGILFEFAAARAQQTGESVDYLVDSIVRGIGRKSVLVLDNLGLSATRLKEQFNGASLASQSVGDVTTAVAKIAQEELTKMGGYAETSATKVGILSAAWSKLGQGISQLVTQDGGLIDFFTGYVKQIGNLIEAQNKGITVSELFRQQQVQEAAITGINIIKQKEFTDNKENNLKVTKEIIAEKTHELLQLQEEGKILDGNFELERKKKVLDLDARIETLNKIQTSIDLNKNNRDILIEQIKLLKGEAAAIIGVKKEEVEELGIIAKKREEIEKIQAAIEATNDPSKIGPNGLLIKQLSKAQDELDVLLGKSKKINDEYLILDGKRVTSAKDLNDYLAYLSDLELFQDKKLLEERKKQRETEAEAEKKLEKEKYDAIVKAAKEAAEEQERLAKHKEELIRNAIKTTADGAIDLTVNTTSALVQLEADRYNQRINQLNDYYDNQLKLAGDNDKAKAEIEKRREKEIDKARKRAFQKNKEAARLQAEINAAGAIARAFADYEYPLSLAIAALAGAEALAQVAVINKQQPTGFKEGVIDLKGPGTTKSDSIPARLSRRESVMTADETISSGRTLRMIRAKKLNDKILDKIISKSSSSGILGFDDSRLLAATNKVARAAAGNDIVNKAGVIYEGKQQGEKTKRYTRSRSLNGA